MPTIRQKHLGNKLKAIWKPDNKQNSRHITPNTDLNFEKNYVGITDCNPPLLTIYFTVHSGSLLLQRRIYKI